MLFIALLAASCNSILNSSLSGTLSEKQMTDILVDIHLSEASLSVLNDSIARLNDTTQLRIRFARIFTKNNIEIEKAIGLLNNVTQYKSILKK